MSTMASGAGAHAAHPVQIRVEPALENRDRLTVGFRFILAIPHVLLVGWPIAVTLSWGTTQHGMNYGLGAGGGVLGAVALVIAVIAWFAIVFTGRYPPGLWSLAAFYLRWRVRAMAYIALLRDEYPPFGDGAYPASLALTPPVAPRDRVTVAFRAILAIPQILAVWVLSIAWLFTTIVAWFAILFTGRYPDGLYRFGVGVLRWNTRVDAYMLLLRDEYPPFSLE